MAYNSEDSEKTFRIGMLCALMCVLGFLFFLFKVDACKSGPTTCKDEFMPFDMATHPTCDIGATAELVTSPPASKAGIMCHCNKPTVSVPDGK